MRPAAVAWFVRDLCNYGTCPGDSKVTQMCRAMGPCTDSQTKPVRPTFCNYPGPYALGGGVCHDQTLAQGAGVATNHPNCDEKPEYKTGLAPSCWATNSKWYTGKGGLKKGVDAYVDQVNMKNDEWGKEEPGIRIYGYEPVDTHVSGRDWCMFQANYGGRKHGWSSLNAKTLPYESWDEKWRVELWEDDPVWDDYLDGQHFGPSDFSDGYSTKGRLKMKCSSCNDLKGNNGKKDYDCDDLWPSQVGEFASLECNGPTSFTGGFKSSKCAQQAKNDAISWDPTTSPGGR